MSSTIAVPVAAKRRRVWAPANALIGGGLLVVLIALALWLVLKPAVVKVAEVTAK